MPAQTISLAGALDAWGGSTPTNLTLLARAMSGFGDAVRTSGGQVAFPKVLLAHYDSASATWTPSLALEPLATGCYWWLELTEDVTLRKIVRTVRFPDSRPTTAWADLVDIDPATTAPATSLPPSVAQVLAQAMAILTGGAGGFLAGTYPNPDVNTTALDAATAGRVTAAGSATRVALNGAFAPLRDVAPIATAAGTAVLNQHNPVDATAASVTIALPIPTRAGDVCSVEKVNGTPAAPGNAVVVSAKFRGSTAVSWINLVGPYESIVFQAKNDLTWWPVAGHKTKTWLDSLYDPAGAATAVQTAAAADATAKDAALAASVAAAYFTLKAAAKEPELLIVGAITRDPSGVVTSAAVVWPDGTAGTYTPTYDGSGAVASYSITYGSPVTKTFTQPTITRDSSGAPTNVPQITVA